MATAYRQHDENDVKGPGISAMEPYAQYVRDAEQQVRMGFVRKVYGILSVQLIVTAGIIAPFVLVDDVKDFASDPSHSWLIYTALGISLVTVIAISCCSNLARNYPTNVVLLGIFTLAEAFLIGVICSRYDPETVLAAAGITCVLVIALTLFAWQTKIDFTLMSGCLFACLICLMLFGFLCYFFQSKIMNAVYCSLGVLLFSFYLVFDTQMMIGNLGDKQHRIAFTVDDYVFAALNLYLDIINLFLFILRLLGRK